MICSRKKLLGCGFGIHSDSSLSITTFIDWAGVEESLVGLCELFVARTKVTLVGLRALSFIPKLALRISP